MSRMEPSGTAPPAAPTGGEPDLDEAVARQLTLAFAPLHKRGFGMAVGLASALSVLALTAMHLIRQPDDTYPLHLLANFFYGYTVTWGGALIGAFWAGVAGFVAGWFAAFVRNLVVAVHVFVVRARAELAQTRDFLDHI